MYPCSQPMNTKSDRQPAAVLSAGGYPSVFTDLFSFFFLFFFTLVQLFFYFGGKHFLSLSGRARIKPLQWRISCCACASLTLHLRLFRNPKVWVLWRSDVFKAACTTDRFNVWQYSSRAQSKGVAQWSTNPIIIMTMYSVKAFTCVKWDGCNRENQATFLNKASLTNQTNYMVKIMEIICSFRAARYQITHTAVLGRGP